MKHIYQFALRRADESKKAFIIERDLMLTGVKLKAKDLEDIATKNKCDIQVTYLGQLTHQPKKEEVLNHVYHTKEDIEKYIDKWNVKPMEVKPNAKN